MRPLRSKEQRPVPSKRKPNTFAAPLGRNLGDPIHAPRTPKPCIFKICAISPAQKCHVLKQLRPAKVSQTGCKTRGHFWRCFSKTRGHFCPLKKIVTLQAGARGGCRSPGGFGGIGGSGIGARGRTGGRGGAGVAPISFSPTPKIPLREARKVQVRVAIFVPTVLTAGSPLFPL